MSFNIVIVGAGGHARVVAATLMAAGQQVIGFIDTNISLHGHSIDGLSVLGGDEVLQEYSKDSIRLANGLGAAGGPLRRREVYEGLAAQGWEFSKVLHPKAIISSHVRLEEGVQVMAGAIVQPGAIVGRGSIINSGAIVEHDCVLGAHCHVAPGAVLTGGAKLGEDCLIGAGAVVIQGVRLGSRTSVGAGAVVIGDHSAGGLLVGVPAKLKTPV